MPRLPLRRRSWLMHILLLTVPFGICTLLLRIRPGRPPDFRETREVFRLNDGVWTATHLPKGGVDQMRVSRSGAVWTTMASQTGVMHLDGGQWKSHPLREPGTAASRFRTGIALAGDDVWAVTREGAARFDGKDWRVYPEALKTRRPVAMAAGPSGVWIIDDKGNLSHFDGQGWNIRNVSEDLHADSSTEDADFPDLTMTDDGRLWIFWDGLWLQDGKIWREIRPAGIDVRAFDGLVGHDTDRVWLARAGEVVAVKTDGSIATRYTAGELGISKAEYIHRVAASGDRVWLSTTTTLLTLRNGRWQQVSRPPGTRFVRDIDLGPDGSAWVVGEQRPLAAIALWVAPGLGACAVALIAIGLLISMWLRGVAENRLAAEQAVANAAGSLPGVDPVADQAAIARQSRSMSWMLPLVLVGVPYVVFAISAGGRLARRYWPGAPEWVPFAGVLAPLLLAGIAIWRWRSRGSRQTSRSRYKQILWKPARYLVYLAVFMLVTRWTPLSWIDRIVPNRMLAHTAKFFAIIILLSLIFSARDIASELLVKAAWRAGDYEGALRRLRWLSFGSPTAIMLESQGVTLSLAGRLPEAEQCFRQALVKSASGQRTTKVRLLCCLGETLNELERYDDARRCFESAIAMGDHDGLGRAGLAELLLAQGTEPQKACDLLDEAIQGRTRGPKAGLLAHKAWALALLGRRREADDAIEQALRATSDASPRPILAIRHWTVGRALLAMERTGQAIEHFRAARDADPRGKYGGLAMQQLKLHSQWGQ